MNINTYITLVTFFMFIALIMNQFIYDPTLKICYWLVMFLVFITGLNVFLSIHFYKKLREDVGIQGARGPPGDKGPTGSDGVCVLSTSCGIANCRGVIEREFLKIFPEYKRINEKLDRSILLNDNDKKILKQINSKIDILMPICENGDYNKKEFLEHIHKSYRNT